MDSSGKLLAEKAIDSVKERGHTNLSGGLLAALEVLYRIPSRDATLVESVLLFTDGKANVGIKDQAQLEKATRWAWLHASHFHHTSVASNPGFPLQILSCSFGEKSEVFFSKAARQNPESLGLRLIKVYHVTM